MNQSPSSSLYRRHRFPREVIAQAVWLYFRFPLSLRRIEETLAAGSVDGACETIRRWAGKLGGEFARHMRHSAPRRADKWRMDEVVVSIAGKNMGCGGPSIRMASSSTFSSKVAGIERLRSA